MDRLAEIKLAWFEIHTQDGTEAVAKEDIIWLIKQVEALKLRLNAHEIALEAREAKLNRQQAVVDAARKARDLCDKFYLKAELEAGTYQIDEDECDVWFARDIIDEALQELDRGED